MYLFQYSLYICFVKSVFPFFKISFFTFCFWVLLFDFQRIVFTVFHSDVLLTNGFSYFGVFVYSLRLDLAAASFLSFLPLILYLLQSFNNSTWLKRFFFLVFGLEIVLVCAIHGAETNAYFEWNHKLTSRVFMHLSNPDEVVRTADYKSLFFFLLIVAIEVLFARFLYRNLLQKQLLFLADKNTWSRSFKLVGGFLLAFAFSFLLARGGWQQIPINIDTAYFSKNQKLNDLSVNSTYFFGNSFRLYLKTDFNDVLPKIDSKEAQFITKNLFSFERNHTNYILKDSKPNVVFVILESWTANAIGSLSSLKGATPHFDVLAKNGVLFTNIYATNTTSEIGNTSILAGYPGIPEVAISLYPEKHRKITSINQVLKKKGYYSSYIFSGDLKYGNIESFIVEHHFDQVLDESDFPPGLPHGKLNYYDEELFKLLIKKINQTRQPFMHCAFTGSTHAPYDYPKSGNPKFSGAASDFLNSVVYADKCIGDFIRKAKKQKWYKNTVFVFVADHGHAAPGIEWPYSTHFFHIPVLFYGEPILKAARGKKVSIIGSQTDIAATLLHQLRMDNRAFPFSKDLLSPNVNPFAFHATIRGYGYVTPKGSLLYNFDSKSYVENEFAGSDFGQAKHESKALFKSFYLNFENLDKEK